MHLDWWNTKLKRRPEFKALTAAGFTHWYAYHDTHGNSDKHYIGVINLPNDPKAIAILTSAGYIYKNGRWTLIIRKKHIVKHCSYCEHHELDRSIPWFKKNDLEPYLRLAFGTARIPYDERPDNPWDVLKCSRGHIIARRLERPRTAKQLFHGARTGAGIREVK
jgi:hypothetical protein